MPAYPAPGQVIANSDNPNFCLYIDPYDSLCTVWEFRYDVPLNDRERLMYRQYGLQTWQEFPPFAEPNPKIMEFFHGKIQQDDSSLLDRMAEFLSGREWNADTSQTIVDMIRSSGREVNDVEQ